jgi:hypothetical protein
MTNIEIITPLEAEEICNISTSMLEAIYNQGYIKKYWYDARFFYRKDEVICLIGIDKGALLGFKDTHDMAKAQAELKVRLNKI